MSDLARIACTRHFAVQRELARLRAAGVVREWQHERKLGPLWEADPGFPGHLELRRYFLAARGTAARIRAAIAPIDPMQLSWLHGPYAEATPPLHDLRVASISRQPQRIRECLAALERAPGQRLTVDAMSIAEWTHRVQRHEMRALGIRRAQRLWLIGSTAELRRRERDEIESRETLRNAIKNWREELSDEWDEGFDPYTTGSSAR